MNPLDPTVMKAWNKGREAGKEEAFKIHKHFLEAMKSVQ